MQVWDTAEGHLREENMKGDALERAARRNILYRLLNRELGSLFGETVDHKNLPMYTNDKAEYNLYFVETAAYAQSHAKAAEYAGSVAENAYGLYLSDRTEFLNGMAGHLHVVSVVEDKTINSELAQLVQTLRLLSARSLSAVTDVIHKYIYKEVGG